EYNLVNFTVNAKRPSEIQRRDGSFYYTCQPISTDSRMNYTSTQTLEYTHSRLYSQQFNKSVLYKNSYCLQIAWNISGSLHGLLGFVIQFFLPVGQNLQEYQQLDHDSDNDSGHGVDDGDDELDSQSVIEDEDDEAGYELREEYKVPIIPLKISKQPDAIYVHDFVNLFGDCSTSQKTKLREEFKNRLRNKYRNLLP
ncbi:unnamed protein product, partial [Trichobilharzia regenti]